MSRHIEIGKRIESERLRLKFPTQEAAARACGVSRPAWGKYERGEARLGGDALTKFIQLGADVDWIFNGVRSTTAALDDHERAVLATMRSNPLYAEALWRWSVVMPLLSDGQLQQNLRALLQCAVDGGDLSVVMQPRDIALIIDAYRVAPDSNKNLFLRGLGLEIRQIDASVQLIADALRQHTLPEREALLAILKIDDESSGGRHAA